MKLASIELISEILPHPNADKLDLAKVLGYTCIVGKDEFKAGDAVIFIQPDTILPDAPWAEFFKKRSSRVRAMKLRNVWSQGIAISPYKVFAPDISPLKGLLLPDRIGNDIAALIGVTKYEPPVPQQLDAKGQLPTGLGKTDEERWNNFLPADLPYGELVDVSLKVDGSSTTCYCKHIDEEWVVGVCSRSLELKLECSNTYTAVEQKHSILEKLKRYCMQHNVSLALRGEAYGRGIQSFNNNHHSKLPLGFAAFSIYNFDTHSYEHKGSQHYFEDVCHILDIPVVPIIERDVPLTPELIKHYAEDISELDGKPFEGVVVKHATGSFKVMNAEYDSQK